MRPRTWIFSDQQTQHALTSMKHDPKPATPQPAPADGSTPFVPMTFTATSDNPTLEDAAKALDIPITAFDREFGVVVIDPTKRLFTVVAQSCHYKNPDGTPFNGPWSNPPIGTYGTYNAAPDVVSGMPHSVDKGTAQYKTYASYAADRTYAAPTSTSPEGNPPADPNRTSP